MDDKQHDFHHRLMDAVFEFDYDSALALSDMLHKFEVGGGTLTSSDDKLWGMLTDKIEAVREKIRKGETSAEPPSVRIENGTDAEDAERWRALVNCGRISAMGCAGLGDVPHDNNYAHLTINMWTVFPDVASDPVALQWLQKFTDIAVKEYRRKKGL